MPAMFARYNVTSLNDLVTTSQVMLRHLRPHMVGPHNSSKSNDNTSSDFAVIFLKSQNAKSFTWTCCQVTHCLVQWKITHLLVCIMRIWLKFPMSLTGPRCVIAFRRHLLKNKSFSGQILESDLLWEAINCVFCAKEMLFWRFGSPIRFVEALKSIQLHFVKSEMVQEPMNSHHCVVHHLKACTEILKHFHIFLDRKTR